MAVMHEPIEDRVGERRLPEVGVPGIDGQLADQDRGSGGHAIVEYFEQVGAILGAERAVNGCRYPRDFEDGRGLANFLRTSVSR